MPKRPSFQFYPADHRKDLELHECSLEARGMWMEVLCVMHESDVYGHLSIGGKPMDDRQIARAIGEPLKVVSRLLRELEDNRVFSRTDDGTIYSRRMVRDEHLRSVRAEAGTKGAAAKHGKILPDHLPKHLPADLPDHLPRQNGQQNPGKLSRARAPSSSSSSLTPSSQSESVEEAPDATTSRAPRVILRSVPAEKPVQDPEVLERIEQRRHQLAQLTAGTTTDDGRTVVEK